MLCSNIYRKTLYNNSMLLGVMLCAVGMFQHIYMYNIVYFHNNGHGVHPQYDFLPDMLPLIRDI